MEQYERDAREAVAKALEDDGWIHTLASFKSGHEGFTGTILRALLPMLRTSELERRALEACETMAAELNGHLGMAETVREAMLIGRESLAAKKGPWVVTSQGNVAAHTDGRSVAFWDNRKGFDHAACAAFVAEQNEREAGRV